MNQKLHRCKQRLKAFFTVVQIYLDIVKFVWYVVVLKGANVMARVLLTSGNAFKRTDNRWGGVVWYQDEDGERKRKSFSSTTKQGVKDKMTKYIRDFEKQEQESNESNQQLQVSMQRWLEVFKYPTVERTTYDRIENTAKNHIYPALGKKIVSNIKAVDIKKILNEQMMNGYAFTTVKKTRDILGEYFRYLIEQEVITKNPMQSVPMIKKTNFYAQQGKELLPPTDTITVFTDDEDSTNASISFYTCIDGLWVKDDTLSCYGFVGRQGTVDNMSEDISGTPKGLYSIGSAFYRNNTPETRLNVFEITQDTYWIDDPDSKFYNQRVEGTSEKDWDSAEHMIDYSNYDYGFVINYNMPAQYNAGSAIFFHVGYAPTAGCVAVSEDMVLQYLKNLDIAKNPYILIN